MGEIKDSGIGWIGNIPINWNIVRAKNIFKNHKNIVGNREDEYERLALTLNGVLKRSKDDSKGLQSESLSTYQILNKNELVFKMIDLANVNTSRVGYSPFTGIVSPVYIIFNNEKYSKFGYYFFYSMWQREIFNKLGNDGVRSALNASDMLNLPFPDISEEEAKKISDFLDEKVSEIDYIIEKTKETIEDYKKYIQTVKEKYLFYDNNTTKKIRLKFLCDITTGNEDTQNSNPEGEYPFYVRSPIVERCDRYTFEGEGILVAGDGAGAGRIFHHVYGKYAVHQRVYRLYNIKCNSDYLHLYLSTLFPYEMDKGSAQSTVPSMRLPMLQNFEIKICEENQEKRIVEKLRKDENKVLKIIKCKEDLIKELNQYKKSLIYEYVTGKKEVI